MSTLLGTNEVAALLGVHPKHVYRLLKRGLPARRVGAEWRFDRDEVLAWTAAPETSLPERATTPAAVPPLLAANGDVCVELLLRHAGEKFGAVIGFVQADRGSAFELLRRGDVAVGGLHGSPGVGDDPLVTVHVVRRTIGLAHAAKRRLERARDVRGLRLASRPTTAGVRQYLDDALAEGGVDPAEAHRTATLHASHRDVVLAVTAGEADVGVTSVAWAARAGLPCLPIAEETYALCMRASALETPPVRALVRALQSTELRRALGSIAGYDARDAGVMSL